MKKILISGYYGAGNFGDELILSLLLDKLKDCKVTVLSHNPRKTYEMYGVHTVSAFSFDHVLKEIISCDVLISGGGSLLQNVTSSASLFFYSSIIKLAKACRKEVVIFAQGIGPIKGWYSPGMVKKLLRKADFVSVRDEKSMELMNKWKVKQAKLVCDPAYSLEVSQPERTKTIGIQLRKFNNITDELFDNIVNQVKLRYFDREIELLCLQDDMDRGVSQIFINKLKQVDPKINVKLVCGLKQQDIIDHISKYDCLIGMRYHACLLAVKYGVKTLAVGYDPKVEMLAKDEGIPCLSMVSKKNDYDKAFDTMENLSRWNLMENSKVRKFSWDDTGIYEIKKEKRKKDKNDKNKKKK
ncbi:MAG: polysaccharide pyruvyl transferase CsaB [Cyanobacteria bacterium RUI128]|nr:polysaccharide pyruvyl transferase CsaB [Cyanobacteria bacterium RUI128]